MNFWPGGQLRTQRVLNHVLVSLYPGLQRVHLIRRQTAQFWTLQTKKIQYMKIDTWMEEAYG